jgi:hypothetical protein
VEMEGGREEEHCGATRRCLSNDNIGEHINKDGQSATLCCCCFACFLCESTLNALLLSFIKRVLTIR